MVFCLTIPATFGLIILSEPIIRIIFEHGAFSSIDTQATAVALSLYGIGLFAYSANKVIVPVYYAINAPRYPVIASFLAIAINILIIVNTIDAYQHKAIALSTSITMVINFLFLTTVLYMKIGGFPLRHLVTGVCKITLASGLMGLMLLGSYQLLNDWFLSPILTQCFVLFILIGGSALFYIIILNLLGLDEFKELTKRFKKKFSEK